MIRKIAKEDCFHDAYEHAFDSGMLESRGVLTTPGVLGAGRYHATRASLSCMRLVKSWICDGELSTRGWRLVRGILAQNECRSNQLEERDIPFHGAPVNLRTGGSYGLR